MDHSKSDDVGLRVQWTPNHACFNSYDEADSEYNPDNAEHHSVIESIDLERESLAVHPRVCSLEAMENEREALAQYSEDHPSRATACGNLATLLWIRYQRNGPDFNHHLSEAIELAQEALLLRPHGHIGHAAVCGNLAVALKTRYMRNRENGLLTEIIDLERMALRLRPKGHADRAISCRNLARSLMLNYHQSGTAHLLEEAIDLQREVLRQHDRNHRSYANLCADLVQSLMMRHERSKDVRLLHEMYGLSQDAMSFAAGKAISRHALELSRIHLQQGTSYYNVPLSIKFLDQSLEHEPDNIFDAVDNILSRLNDLWEHDLQRQDRTTVASIYNRIIDLLPLLVNPLLDAKSQSHTLRSCGEAGSDAFLNAVLGGEWKSGLSALEMTRGLIWTQHLHQRNPQSQDIPGLLAIEFEGLLQAISLQAIVHRFTWQKRLVIPSVSLLHSHGDRMYALLRQIRALPGLDRFMLGEVYETLCTAASKHPVAVLVAARDHFYCLILDSRIDDKSTLLKLAVTQKELNYGMRHAGVILRTRRGAACTKEVQGHLVESRGVRMSCVKSTMPLNRYLMTIWLKIVKPVIDHLGLRACNDDKRSRLYWCPTGIFTSVPLHAAGIYDGPENQMICCADLVVSSYTPTITTLMRAQRHTKTLHRDEISLMLVAEKDATNQGVELLPGVDAEIRAIFQVAESFNIQIMHQETDKTTIDGASTALHAANIVHLACHGVQDDEDAFQSGFCLGDGRLTISNLMDLDIKHGFLAFLSACETAKSSVEQPDQAMHLAAAMLFAGFKSVVASMWAITDHDAPKVARWFYEELFAQEVVEADTVAFAFATAVCKLRDSGVPPDRWVPFIHMGA